MTMPSIDHIKDHNNRNKYIDRKFSFFLNSNLDKVTSSVSFFFIITSLANSPLFSHLFLCTDCGICLYVQPEYKFPKSGTHHLSIFYLLHMLRAHFDVF